MTAPEESISQLVVIARIKAKPGRGNDMLALLSELAARVLQTEPDTCRYAFYVEPAVEPLHVTVIQGYPTRAAMDSHNTGVLTEYLPSLLDMADSAPEIVELVPAELTVSAARHDTARLTV